MTQITHPELRSMDFYLFQSKQLSLLYDQIESSCPLIYDPITPAEIDSVFDLISYDKGAALLRMIEHLIGEETYKKGIVYYLEKMSYKSANYKDLAEGLQKAVNESRITFDKPIEDIIYNFSTNPGFPLVTVTSIPPYRLRFEQTRFLEDKHNASYPLYKIKIDFTTKSSPDTPPNQDWYWFPDEIMEIHWTNNADEWIVVNYQSAGYYRVNYDNVLWKRIIKALDLEHEKVHLYNRAQLVDDVLYLARGGWVSYSTMLNVWKYLAKEKDFVPWSSANIGLFFLLPKLTDANCKLDFMRFLRQIMKPIYKHLGPRDRYEEGVGDKYNRQFIRLLACTAGEEDCVNDAKEQTQNYFYRNHTIDPDLRAITFCNGLRFVNKNDFNLAFAQLMKSTDLVLRSDLIYGLSCNQNENNVELLLNSTINTNSFKYFETERDDLLTFVISNSATGVGVAINFIQNQFKEIGSHYSKPEPVRSQVALMSNFITSDRLLGRYEELLTVLVVEKIVNEDDKETFLELSQKNVEWVRKNDKPLGDALKTFFNNSGRHLIHVTLLLGSLFYQFITS